MTTETERVVVVGAGLSGLAVAVRLLGARCEVVVLEASSRVGGQIDTFSAGPLVVELGAEGFVSRSRAVPALAAFLGIEGALVEQLTTDTFALEQGQLVLLPPGEAARRLGFQVPPEELGRGIRSFARGMGQLVDALAARLSPAQLRLRTSVAAIARGEAGLSVQLDEGQPLTAAAVVLAVPARQAAALLAPLGLAECAPLAVAPVLSNVSVNLLYSCQQFSTYPAGSGVIFPEGFAEVGLRAFSLVDHKFPGRVGAGQALLRVFFRPSEAALAAWSDERFAGEAAKAIARVLPVEGGPTRSWVSRWADALPVFSADYRAQVAAVDPALQRLGIHVTGSAFHGAGIDAAVGSAEWVAERLAHARA